MRRSGFDVDQVYIILLEKKIESKGDSHGINRPNVQYTGMQTEAGQDIFFYY